MLNSVFQKKGGELRRLPETVSNCSSSRLGEYDQSTFFYDVFARGQNEIIAIGPPPLNIRSCILPVKIVIEGRSYEFKKLGEWNKLIVLSVVLPSSITFPVAAEMIFPEFSYAVQVNEPEVVQGSALVTVQKDNRVEWIEDWIDHYKSKFGIEHVYIYDNGSSYERPLQELLGSKAKVVDWGFPYGVGRIHRTQFCQIGALNHFKLKHARHCQIFNFDIDELLVCNEKTRIKLFSSDYLRFDSCWVPIDKEAVNEGFSFRDFHHRERNFRGEAFKYIVNSELNGMMSVHYFKREEGLLGKILGRKSKVRAVPSNEGFFMHFKGINTGWKKHLKARVLGDDIPHEQVVKIEYTL